MTATTRHSNTKQKKTSNTINHRCFVCSNGGRNEKKKEKKYDAPSSIVSCRIIIMCAVSCTPQDACHPWSMTSQIDTKNVHQLFAPKSKYQRVGINQTQWRQQIWRHYCLVTISFVVHLIHCKWRTWEKKKQLTSLKCVCAACWHRSMPIVLQLVCDTTTNGVSFIFRDGTQWTLWPKRKTGTKRKISRPLCSSWLEWMQKKNRTFNEKTHLMAQSGEMKR